MKILVMGGTEFISSSVAKYFISKDHEVHIFTRGKRPVKYAGIKTHHIEDRNNIEDLKNSIKGIDYDVVFDISAYNEEDVKKLLSVLSINNLKRYIFCSSGAIYKENEGISKENYEVGENKNWGDYGLNKLKAENYLMKMYNEKKLPVVMFRPTYVYGEYNNLYRESYIFDRINSGKDIPIPKSSNRNQFIYIDDLLKVFESAIYNENAVGQAYNITNNEEFTWKEYVEAGIKAVGKSINIIEIDKELEEDCKTYFPFRDCNYILDIDKLKKDGLYIPRINLVEGLKKSYKWYCKEKPTFGLGRMTKIEEVLTLYKR